MMPMLSRRLSISGSTTQPSPKIEDPKSPKLKASPRPSPQLKRWSRARSIRSGRKLERPVQERVSSRSRSRSRSSIEEMESSLEGQQVVLNDDDEMEEGCQVSGDDGGKCIYMVSDGTGWTAEHTVTAALGQFDYCLVDRGCPVSTHLFSGIDDVERLMEIIKQAAKEGAMVVYTLADRSMAESARQACKLWEIPCTDILSPITEAVATHLGVSPSGLPRGAPGRNSALSEDYFRRIEAIEFTIKQDDGALPQNLHKADIVLAGVSRTGKTPLSIYLAQKGYKVANVPLVMGINAPKALFEIDPEKVFGLTINPVVLQTIRWARAKTLGLHGEAKSNYSEMDYIRKELEYASTLFAQNPVWPVIEVTGKAIEETAAVILRLYQDRKNRCSMPRISKRY